MIKTYKVLAVIPARGGSKRIPKKNIKEMCGKPLIAWTIQEALKSKYIDRLITSTDDPEIAEVAKLYKSEVPFLRPAEISGDEVTDYPVFTHAVTWMKNQQDFYADIVVQLRPTSPLRTVKEIDAAIELLVQNQHADSVRTVTEPDQSPYKMYSITQDNVLAPLLQFGSETESFNLPTQKLPKAYKHVGYVDVMWHKTLFEKKQMTGNIIIPYILERAYSGINKPDDWHYYEFLFKQHGIC